MLKKRCYLCGGKLVDGRCVDCGLDNTRNDRKSYRLNCTTAEFAKERNRTQGNPIHVLEERKSESYTKPASKKTQKHTYHKKDVNKNVRRKAKAMVEGKKLSASKIIKIIVFVVIAFNLLPFIIGGCVDGIHHLTNKIQIWQNITDSSRKEKEEQPYYYNASYDLSQEGEKFEIELTQGIYKVGVHIPEGIYKLERVSGNGFCNLNDDENGLYKHWWISGNKENEKDGAVQSAEDVRLYQGGYFTVNSDVKIQLSSTCAQIEKMISTVPNPLTEKFYLKEAEEYVVGEEFPAGTYDLTCEKDYAGVLIEHDDRVDSYWVSVHNENESVFKNICLSEGMTVNVQSGNAVFIPATEIESVD